MRFRILTITVLCAAALHGQGITNYLGPAVLTRGDNGIGTRGGNEDINIRPYVNISSFFNSGLLLAGTDSNGNISQAQNQYGFQAGFGAYGRHNFRRSVLSLDYNGYYRYYSTNQFFNGTNQMLALGYTTQLSRKWVLGFRQTAGTLNSANAYFSAQTATAVTDNVVDQTTLLFDNRSTYAQSGMNASYLLTPRTSVTLGGSGYLIRRRSASLVGLNGWTVNGNIDHRVSPLTTVGVNFTHSHIDYPKAFGQTNMNGFALTLARTLGRNWTLSMQAGLYQVETEGQRRVQPDNAVENLFGNRPIVQSYYRNSKVPRGMISLTRSFRQSSFTASYTRGINNGNGVYLTSRMENLSLSYSLQGRRKWGAGLTAYGSRMHSIGQGLASYQQLSGGGNINYQLTSVMSLNVGFYERQFSITGGTHRNYHSVSFGFSFSPPGIPLSLY